MEGQFGWGRKASRLGTRATSSAQQNGTWEEVGLFSIQIGKDKKNKISKDQVLEAVLFRNLGSAEHNDGGASLKQLNLKGRTKFPGGEIC